MQNLNALHTRVGRCCMIDCRRMKIKNRTLHKKREERGTPKFKRGQIDSPSMAG